MIDYILFEKTSKNEWTIEKARGFVLEQEVPIISIVEEKGIIIVQTGERKEDDKMRLIEITPDISFLVKDDPALDEFTEVETLENATTRLIPLDEDPSTFTKVEFD
jgi:hypothetical protein